MQPSASIRSVCLPASTIAAHKRERSWQGARSLGRRSNENASNFPKFYRANSCPGIPRPDILVSPLAYVGGAVSASGVVCLQLVAKFHGQTFSSCALMPVFCFHVRKVGRCRVEEGKWANVRAPSSYTTSDVYLKPSFTTLIWLVIKMH